MDEFDSCENRKSLLENEEFFDYFCDLLTYSNAHVFLKDHYNGLSSGMLTHFLSVLEENGLRFFIKLKLKLKSYLVSKVLRDSSHILKCRVFWLHHCATKGYCEGCKEVLKGEGNCTSLFLILRLPVELNTNRHLFPRKKR